ncbi:MAG: chlorophyll synthase ChlG [Alphaproteobacteria bacterium]|nr:chlorophyll synthase ChlG [Alphaproteobacteria bacterium]
MTTAVVPAPAAVLELLKPITWFPPMWAFGCGAVSAGVAVEGRWGLIAAGILLAGPLVCATSQIVNDWYDRHVDAINQPARPIPSGRIPGRWGLRLALAWTGLSLVVAVLLGPVVFAAAVVGLALAWAYSAPPLRLKRNGWWGNLAVGLSYESLPWFTGAAVLAGTMPRPEVVGVALLYGLGAHGIMTLNDFKAIEGDVRTGVGSLPVRLGVDGAARLACVVMAASQLAVVALLVLWGRPLHAAIVTGLLAAQGGLMVRFLARPRERATWYSGLGVTLYVLGMLTAAFALAGLDG